MGLTVLDWLLRHILHHDPVPPPPPIPTPPSVPVTTPAEKRRIDERLRSSEQRLAELQAWAGLDELRTRHREAPHHG